ncbi:MAG: hypothetical protein GQ574_14055 [Crocinitomix sp.]|nr:hypothetical protein [Crocinitomix sp.]
MSRYVLLTLFVIFSSEYTFSQADTLNQLDSDEKKTGWWITYLDENLEVLKDSIGATHCMYNYYWQNIYLYRYGEGYGSKKNPIHFPENDTSRLGNYVLLDGKYMTKYKNGNVRSVLSASKGILIEFKKYYPKGQLKFEILYSEECGAPKQHCLREYNKDGSMKYDGHTWLPKKGK